MAKTPPLALYVHWPYCRRLCPYCDFNIYRDRGGDHAALAGAIVRAMAGWAARMDDPRPLHSLSFGGGTPSLLDMRHMDAIIEQAARLFGFEDNVEISLEANPLDCFDANIKAWKEAGLTRLSIGVQSFDEAHLAFLGRDHSGAAARDAIAAARTHLDNVSADFIYDLPGQSPAQWEKDLRAAIGLGLPHYSFYALTIEPGTAFARRDARGALGPRGDDNSADLFNLTHDIMADAGLPAYEISNHARRRNDQSRHNLVYWQSGDWLGLGPGAHGRITMGGARHALVTHARPQDYINAVNASGWGVQTDEILDLAAIAMERLAMGLRLKTGIALTGQNGDIAAHIDVGKKDALCAQGLIVDNGKTLAATRTGWPFIDYLTVQLLGG